MRGIVTRADIPLYRRINLNKSVPWVPWERAPVGDPALIAADTTKLYPHDIDALQLLYDCLVLSTPTLARCVYQHTSRNTRTHDAVRLAEIGLRGLWRRGMVLQSRPRSVGSGCPPFLWRISAAGYELLRLHSWQYIPEQNPDRGYTPAKCTNTQTYHHATVNGFCARWIDRVEDASEPEDAWIEWTPCGKTTFTAKVEGQHIQIRPDAVVTVGMPGNANVYFVEWERSASKQHLWDKLARLAAFNAVQAWRPASLFAAPRYLVVAWDQPDPALARRKEQLCTLAALRDIAAEHEEGQHTVFVRGEDIDQGRYMGHFLNGKEVDLLWNGAPARPHNDIARFQ